jgi:glycosyltransferase involved in cell wall biosynthesis
MAMGGKLNTPVVAVVIPCFRVTGQILDVITKIGPEVSQIFVVDDGCPDGSGTLVQTKSIDPRVKVIFHGRNLGVGGAVVSGYRAAIEGKADIVVKLDGDGQMDPKKIDELIAPIIANEADYTKGDRLDSLDGLSQMPIIRLLGNAGLTLLNKISSGYWNIKDPTNGFTAIHTNVLIRMPLDKLDKRYFFESDSLFRLSVIRAVVMDVPIPARYANERSNLSIIKSLIRFPWKLFMNFSKRIFYNYYLRDVSAASIELPLGAVLWWFGFLFGLNAFITSVQSGAPATTGTVMLSVLPLILGFQLLLAFLSYDIENVPSKPMHRQAK